MLEDKWISVEDRLPETHGFCIICDKESIVVSSFYVKGQFVASLDGVDYIFDEITHWQPLPEPPK